MVDRATAPKLSDAVSHEKDIDGVLLFLNGLHEFGMVVQPAGVRLGVTRSPITRRGCDRPQLREMLMNFVPRFPSVFRFEYPLTFSVRQRPAEKLRVHFTLIVGIVGVFQCLG